MALDILKGFFLNKYKAYRNYLYYWNCLVVLDHDELKLKLFKHIYNLLVASHLSREKTLELL